MGKAKADNVWITIMSNINILAVATLSDVSCIILSEGTSLEKEMITTAMEKGINVLSSALTSYEVAVRLNSLGI
jgi:serine kinase of HPr protein (carbohydrate metabolism regulator)